MKDITREKVSSMPTQTIKELMIAKESSINQRPHDMAVSSLNNLPRINPKKNPLTDRTTKNYYSSATESQKMIVRLTNGRTRSNEVLVSKQRDSGSF